MGGFFPSCKIVKCENISISRKDFVDSFDFVIGM
jgi:hypothetical protein